MEIVDTQETMLGLVAGALSLVTSPRIGQVHVRFAAPISVRSVWLRWLGQRRAWWVALAGPTAPSTASAQLAVLASMAATTGAVRQVGHAVTGRLAHAVMGALGAATPVTATAWVATCVLLPPAVRRRIAGVAGRADVASDRGQDVDMTELEVVAESIYRLATQLGVHFTFSEAQMRSEVCIPPSASSNPPSLPSLVSITSHLSRICLAPFVV